MKNQGKGRPRHDFFLSFIPVCDGISPDRGRGHEKLRSGAICKNRDETGAYSHGDVRTVILQSSCRILTPP